MGGSVYFLVFSPYLKIKNITIEGAEKISSDEAREIGWQLVNEELFGLIPMDSIVVFSGQKIKNILLDKYPQIKDIKIIKKLPALPGLGRPASVLVQITERQEAAHYCNHGQCFLLDKDGIAFEKDFEIYGGMKVCLRDNSNREVKIREKILEPELIAFLVSAQNLLREEVNISLMNFEINTYPTAEASAITSDGWKILFDLNNSPAVQIAALRQVLEEKIKDQRDNLEYIDLRVENRVYYKLKQLTF